MDNHVGIQGTTWSKISFFLAVAIIISMYTANARELPEPIIIDHRSASLSDISDTHLINARENLVIAYGHTSHGSQIITGMQGLVTFKGDGYSFSSDGTENTLELRDRPFSGANDLGNPDRKKWEEATRSYLDTHPEVNVIMWSWCGQVSSASESDIELYLTLMNALEDAYSDVMFVYMTGHLDGSGLDGNLHKRNEQIREFCVFNNKILFDFADIESYNPNGEYFGDKRPNDNCDYDSDGNGSRDANWAVEWQNANPGEWYECSSAHSQPLNANMKAYAAWRLFVAIAECEYPTTIEDNSGSQTFSLADNYPNPFNSSTVISFIVENSSTVELSIFNSLGQSINTLTSGNIAAGFHSVVWNGTDTSGNGMTSGLYYYRLSTSTGISYSKKMLYLK